MPSIYPNVPADGINHFAYSGLLVSTMRSIAQAHRTKQFCQHSRPILYLRLILSAASRAPNFLPEGGAKIAQGRAKQNPGTHASLDPSPRRGDASIHAIAQSLSP